MEGTEDADCYSSLSQVFQDGTPGCLEWNRRIVSNVQALHDPNKRTLHLQREVGSANGIRTRVTAVRGRCPRPLDDSAGVLCVNAKLP